jgi:hypothetical protein
MPGKGEHGCVVSGLGPSAAPAHDVLVAMSTLLVVSIAI